MKKGICTYCYKYKKLTNDHIPPKSIFAKPRPNNLITVPCCNKCHKETFLDDEYFRTIMVLDDANKEHEDIKKILPNVMKDLRRPTKWKFTLSLFNSSFPVELFSPTGLSLGKKYAFKPEGERLANVIKRIVRGLFYHEENRRISPDAMINTDILDFTKKDSIFFSDNFQNTIWKPLLNEKKHIIGNNSFVYWYKLASDNKDTSVWLMLFFNKRCFLGITAPPM